VNKVECFEWESFTSADRQTLEASCLLFQYEIWFWRRLRRQLDFGSRPDVTSDKRL